MRLPDWPERLAKVIEEWEHKDFSWGAGDCVCFAGAVHEAVTGIDAIARWRGKYFSKEEARKLMRGELGDEVSAVLGPPISHHRARRGDIVMVRGGLGVCLGPFAAVRGQKSGLVRVPMGETKFAWPIGAG